MLRAGDLIERNGLYLVRKLDEELATAFLEATNGESSTIDIRADESTECVLVANPARDWPSVPLARTHASRKLVGVMFNGLSLNRFADWVRLDEFQLGGRLFLNPELKLGFRDRLVVAYSPPAEFAVGSDRSRIEGRPAWECVPVEVPRMFVSLAQRAQLQAEAQSTQSTRNLFDHLMEDDEP